MSWPVDGTRVLLLLAVLMFDAAGASAQRHTDAPVGIVISAGQGGAYIPARSETPLAARSGDILFPGDTLRAGSKPIVFLFCPDKMSDEIAPSTEVLFQPARLTVRSGKVTQRNPASSCFLPTVARLETASQQHYGASLVRGVDSLAAEEPVSPDRFDAATRSDIAMLNGALSANPGDAASLVSRAATFEKHGLSANALADYRKAASIWPEAVWLKGKIFELREAIAAASAPPSNSGPDLSTGKTYAILIGISKYQKLPQDLWLEFAEADAKAFQSYLASPRGGAVLPDNMLLLTNEKATTAAMRNAFQTFLKGRAGRNDTVVILVAAHGTVETPGNKGAYIVTYDTDPQDLGATGFPMVEIQDLLQTQLTNIGRVLLFVDACHAGSIGSIRSTTVNANVQELGQTGNANMLGFMASLPKELSREGTQFGGGHGAFTYFVLKGFDGAADEDKSGIVTENELVEYVRAQVPAATTRKQHPREFGTLGAEEPLADMKKAASPITLRELLAPPVGRVLLASASPQAPLSSAAERDYRAFEHALWDHRLLPGAVDNAFDALETLRTEVSPESFQNYRNELRIALENDGQQLLLRYLEGDQAPQMQADFARGASDMRAASQLTPGSVFLDSRLSFFAGRALLFDRKYREAADLLERSVRADPSSAYAYNALGIAYLEQADFGRSLPAFRDALRRAPQWTYPYHNLALASIETGDYDAAIRLYRQAIQLTPQFSYLHYNLGLVYERINRRKEAAEEFQKAIDLSPGLADAYNGLGSLRATGGQFAKAEESYRRALELTPGLYAARQNLALLLAARTGRRDEAIALWRDNLARNPEYLPSRVSLAETLAGGPDRAAAIAEYRQVVDRKPEYLAARIALAGLLLKAGAGQEALDHVEAARKLDPDNAEILELMGDSELSFGQVAEAAQAFQSALAASPDRAAKRRLRIKLSEARGLPR